MSAPIVNAILRVVLPYVFFAGLWILLSDTALEAMVTDPATFAQLSIYKGWVFVLVTALLLATLLRGELRKRERSHLELERRVAERTRELGEREGCARALADEQKLLLEHIQVGIVFTGDGRILRANPKFAELFGYDDPAQLAGTDTTILFPSTDEALRFLATVKPKLATGEAVDVEWRGARRDGSRFFGHTIARAITAPGYELAAIWMVEDITARKEAEREVAELSLFLQAIIDHIPNPIFYKGPDLRFRGCNRAYEETFGVARENFVGKTVLELEYLPKSDRDTYQDEDARMVADSATLRREALIPFADGRAHQTLYSVSGFRGPDGTPGGLVGIIVDITPLKEAEADLREAKHAAEAADRLKSAFLATMSHELRTPLNSIIGFTGILLQGLAGPLNAEQGKQLGMVQGSARHLLSLINDVLDISKIEAGELPLARESFDLGASIARVAGIVTPLAANKRLDLTVEGAEHAGSMIGDARRVEQILLNLLSNAIKFTEAGNVTLSVTTASHNIQKKHETEMPVVRLRVADTGIGIKPEELAQLFQPFRQVDSTLTRRHEGTGLGLAICRRLTDMMGGTIEVESRFGEGSVFTVTLPLAAVDASPAQGDIQYRDPPSVIITPRPQQRKQWIPESES